MTTWVAWAVFAALAMALGVTGYHFSVATVRAVAAVAALALVVAVDGYGLRHPAAAPGSLTGAFTRGADQIASAFFTPLWAGHGVPQPGRDGWIAICVLLLGGYRELEAWALHWQAPVLDTSQLDAGKRNELLAAEITFRLTALQVRSPSILPGGSRSGALASIAENSGVSGGGLAGAVIRFAGLLWPRPRRLVARMWAEPATAGGTRVTVELTDARSGATVAAKTVAAGSPDEAAAMVAGYVARQVFERDPAAPPWCYGAADGHDLGAGQLARAERVDIADAADVRRSRAAQVAILRKVAGGERCAGLVRYELAQLLDLGQDHLTALRLHAVNRERYPRFFRGRYRLAMSLGMIANSGFVFTRTEAARESIEAVLGILARCGTARAAGASQAARAARAAQVAGSPESWFSRRGDGWVLSKDLNAVLLDAARGELRAIRRQLTLPAVAWAMLVRRDERATWKPHLRLRVRQGFRDGADASLLLVAVRQRLNDPRVPRRRRQAGALRIAAAITGDSEPVAMVLRQPSRDWTLRGGPPTAAPDRVRWLPWLRRTASWQAAYAVACLYAALARQGLAREDRIVASLRRAVGNPDSEMERSYDWISNDPDFRPQIGNPGKYPAFTAFLRAQERVDYPGTDRAPARSSGRSSGKAGGRANGGKPARQPRLFAMRPRT